MPFERVYFTRKLHTDYTYLLEGDEIESATFFGFHNLFNKFANYREHSNQTTIVNEVQAPLPDFEFSMIQRLNTLMNSRRRTQVKLARLEGVLDGYSGLVEQIEKTKELLNT